MKQTIPLSFQQQWLWELIQKNKDWNCVVSHVLRLKGRLSTELLRESFDKVLRRHGSLRSRISTVDGAANQLIDEPRACRLDSISIGGASKQEIKANAVRFAEEYCDRKVDPAAGPLLNFILIRLSEDEHWLVLAVHRLIADCYSTDHMLQELWAFYSALFCGRPSPLLTESPQYADYALWQRSTESAWLQRHGAYWASHLSGAKPLQWPIEETGATRGTLGKMKSLLGEALSTELRNLAQRERTLLANVVLAVYVATIWGWCGQRDFVLPFMIAGRQSEHKSIVGYFSHVLYLRVQLTGQETFSELLSCVGNEFFRALSHQDFGRLAAQVPAMLSGTFFQWVTWHPDEVLGQLASISSKICELTVERVPLRDFGEGLTAIPPGMVEVEVTFFDTANGIYASGVYRADHFKQNVVDQFMADIRSTLESFVRNPKALVADFIQTKDSDLGSVCVVDRSNGEHVRTRYEPPQDETE